MTFVTSGMPLAGFRQTRSRKIGTKNNNFSRKFTDIKSKGKVHNVKTSTDFKDHPHNLQFKRKKQNKAHLL